jgi:hypothetical protein
LLKGVQQSVQRFRWQLEFLHALRQGAKYLGPAWARGSVSEGGVQISAKLGQITQPLRRRRGPFIGDVICRSGELVDGHHGWPQGRRAQHRGNGEIFVVVNGHGVILASPGPSPAARDDLNSHVLVDSFIGTTLYY